MSKSDSSAQKNLAGAALFSFELVIVLILFIASLIVLSLLTFRVFQLKDEQFDHLVFEKVSVLVSNNTTSFLQFITFLGSTWFLTSVNLLLAVYFLFIRKHKWYSIKVPVIALGGVLLMLLMKQFFNRPRPLTPLLEAIDGFSFPSGHSFMGIVTYGLLILLIWNSSARQLQKIWLIFCLVLLILLIGFSRIYLRVHYFSDVMAGFSAGIIWLSLSLFTIRKIERYSSQNLDPSLSEIDKSDS